MVEIIPSGKNFLSIKFVKMLGKKGLICPLTENDLPVLEGIRDGVNAFAGPQVIHLDLTNRCNLNCIACWCNSPFIFDKGMDPDTRKKYLSRETRTSDNRRSPFATFRR